MSVEQTVIVEKYDKNVRGLSWGWLREIPPYAQGKTPDHMDGNECGDGCLIMRGREKGGMSSLCLDMKERGDVFPFRY